MRYCNKPTLGLILVVLLLAGSGRAADTAPSEYKLKAAFLYHFSQFVDWPPAAHTDTRIPFVIGILGENPFGSELEQTVQNKVIGGRALVVKQFQSLTEATNGCQILFISSSEQRSFPEIMSRLAGTSILTVGEAENFGAAGGMIQFIFEGNKIRFRINEAATIQSNLKVSAKLLSLASHTKN